MFGALHMHGTEAILRLLDGSLENTLHGKCYLFWLLACEKYNGSATLSIKLGSTTLTLTAGSSAVYYADGTTNGLIKLG